MAVRVRKDGTMICAALSEAMEGDTYIDDTLHYMMSQEFKVITSFPYPKHTQDPRWFWVDSAPKGVDKNDRQK